MKNIEGPIWNRKRDLSAWSAVPQPTILIHYSENREFLSVVFIAWGVTSNSFSGTNV